jgi:hypothetical protein
MNSQPASSARERSAYVWPWVLTAESSENGLARSIIAGRCWSRNRNSRRDRVGFDHCKSNLWGTSIGSDSADTRYADLVFGAFATGSIQRNERHRSILCRRCEQNKRTFDISKKYGQLTRTRQLTHRPGMLPQARRLFATGPVSV